MAATGQQTQPLSESAQRIRQYMLENEEITYSFRFRPTGLTNWLKSLLGFGVTHWFVTNQRLIQETRVGGGFTFKDIPHNKISSIEYGSKVSLLTIAIGILIAVSGVVIASEVASEASILIVLGLVLVGYAYWRRQQVLIVKGSGGVTFSLAISKGEQVDEILWYLHAERYKQTT
ncbi:MAG: hypothetical protein V5A34_02475 [Halapricum sp.]